MNACNTNKPQGSNKRNAFIDNPKVLKRLQWVQDVDKRVQQKVSQRIKVIRPPKPSSMQPGRAKRLGSNL